MAAQALRANPWQTTLEHRLSAGRTGAPSWLADSLLADEPDTDAVVDALGTVLGLRGGEDTLEELAEAEEDDQILAEDLRAAERLQTLQRIRAGADSGWDKLKTWLAGTKEFDLADVSVEKKVLPESGSQYMLKIDGKKSSFWHDVPLHPPGRPDLFHFVCEIPKGTTAKMEISKDHTYNPIIHEIQNGKPRHYNYRPEVGSLVNYGAIPQTYESPDVPDERTGMVGDSDAVDVLQLNAKRSDVGSIQRVRVLGGFALMDGGETDWKIFVEDVDDPDAIQGEKLRDVISKRHEREILHWFRDYKIPDGKGRNSFALKGRIVSAEEARAVIMEHHRHWQELARTG